MRMKKKPLNLLVDEDLVKRARNNGINLSSFFEIRLREYLSLIEKEPASSIKNSPERIRTAGAGSKGQRVNRYTTGLS